MLPRTILLLGSGELGREVAIAAKRLGCVVIAVDRYDNAPAMQVADKRFVIDMLDGSKIREIVEAENVNLIVPEIEAIDTEELLGLEQAGFNVIPSAYATSLTMNRDKIRDVAAQVLGVETAKFGYAESYEQLLALSGVIGFPLVIKPVMSSSGKGQSIVKNEAELETAYQYAIQNMRGNRAKVIAEEFIDFDFEVTLLSIKEYNGKFHFCPVIGHRQERGDYQESWQPAPIFPETLENMKNTATKVITHLTQKPGGSGAGLFGVEFFIKNDKAIFSELSPRPHDTGLVTLISQNYNEFELHVRAILGLPIPNIINNAPSASAVILGDRPIYDPKILGVYEALSVKPNAQIHLFNKPESYKHRRMGVALASSDLGITEARSIARQIASKIKIV